MTSEKRRDDQRGALWGWLDSEIGLALIAGAVFAAPFLIAPLTYPPYYEDESWVFVPVFELLRGQGVSVGALGFDQHPFPLFFLIVAPFAGLLSPLGPEMSVRGAALLAGLAALWGCFALARAADKRAGAIACAVFLCVPMLFQTMHYGRTDALALALALWSAAAALSRRPSLAGALVASAICTHPLMIWTLPLGLWLAYRSQKFDGALRFLVPLAIGGVLQVGWLALNRDTALMYWKHYTSTAAGYGETSFLQALLKSFAHEGERYAAYVRSLSVWDRLLQLLIIGLGVALGAIRAIRTRDWPPLVSVLGIAITVSALVGTKQPYHLIFVLALACTLTAYGVSAAPSKVTTALTIGLILVAGFRYTGEAWATRPNINIVSQMEGIERITPPNAIVFGPLVYAGLLGRRSDVRYLSFHALSPREKWRFPSCATMDARLVEVVHGDRRVVGGRRGAQTEVRDVYILTPSYDAHSYLGAIYGDLSPESIACLTKGRPVTPDQALMCGANDCSISTLIHRRIQP